MNRYRPATAAALLAALGMLLAPGLSPACGCCGKPTADANQQSSASVSVAPRTCGCCAAKTAYPATPAKAGCCTDLPGGCDKQGCCCNAAGPEVAAILPTPTKPNLLGDELDDRSPQQGPQACDAPTGLAAATRVASLPPPLAAWRHSERLAWLEVWRL